MGSSHMRLPTYFISHGSGLGYHNLRNFGSAARDPAAQFDQWLQPVPVEASPAERSERLVRCETAPSARRENPKQAHLLPLMVDVGAAGNDKATCVYHQGDFFGAITMSSFMFDSSQGEPDHVEQE